MLRSEARALRNNDILNTAHDTGDQIQLAFADDGKACIENSPFGFIKAVENFAFGKNRRFWRVDVLGRFFVSGKDASTESDNAALLIANGENQTAAETVIVMVAALLAED